MKGTLHYFDHCEIDESVYGLYLQDGSTGGYRRKIEEEKCEN